MWLICLKTTYNHKINENIGLFQGKYGGIQEDLESSATNYTNIREKLILLSFQYYTIVIPAKAEIQTWF